MTTETETEIELKPCPFCGNEHIFITERHFSDFASFPGDRIKYSGYCPECGTESCGKDWIDEGKGEPGFHCPEEAAAAWNLRGGA
ncbi:Lar family restriction alleviation protein [Hyphomonas sp.]|uniref:Lar family restriction alleviation protein n=1 Tax=Hyphomonas sp. TaxID=87 RepID=UPI00391D7AC2